MKMIKVTTDRFVACRGFEISKFAVGRWRPAYRRLPIMKSVGKVFFAGLPIWVLIILLKKKINSLFFVVSLNKLNIFGMNEFEMDLIYWQVRIIRCCITVSVFIFNIYPFNCHSGIIPRMGLCPKDEVF